MGKRGGAGRGGEQSVEGVRWRKRRRSGGDDGSGDGDDGGGDDGVGEEVQRTGEQESEWQVEDEKLGGARPAAAPSLEEEVGRRRWRRSEGGRGVGVRSGGGDAVTERSGSESQLLSAATT